MRPKNKTKVAIKLFGLLLCVLLVQTTFAAENIPAVAITTENTTFENVTVANETAKTIELQSTYLSDTIEAGKEYTYQIKIKNVASRDVTIDPKLTNTNLGYGQGFDNNAIEISAPSIIKAGEVTNMTMRVHVPENVTASGAYNGIIDMGVDGKINDGSTPQMSMYFAIGEEPTVPFAKTFKTTTADSITIEVSYSAYDFVRLRVSPKYEKPDVKLGLTHDSSCVNMTLVKSVNSGYVTANFDPIWAIENGNIYQDSANNYVETYKVPGAIGNWKLCILPKNVNSFTYSVTVGENNLAK